MSVDKVHEVSLASHLPSPWASTLVSITPSNIRTEPAQTTPTMTTPTTHIGSILLNISGKIMMIQHEAPDDDSVS